MNPASLNVQTMVDRLNSPHPWIRLRATFCLASWGREAKAAIPALLQTLKDSSKPVRQAVALALGQIGDEVSTPALVGALKDEDSAVRRQAILALKKIGSQTAIPALRRAVWDKDEKVGKAAIQAIEKIFPEANRRPAA